MSKNAKSEISIYMPVQGKIDNSGLGYEYTINTQIDNYTQHFLKLLS